MRWYVNDRYIAFEIADDGVGAFRNMAETRGLETEYDAIGEISKGKQTTAPWAHSGLGIYFSSQMVDRFVLSSGHLSWIVDSRLNDVAVEWLEDALRGTLVHCEVDADTTKTQLDVFNAFAPPSSPGVHRSHVRVALFERGPNLVSRTEAKRLAAELDSFGEVEIDFRGVGQVGQGFIDEPFRVWQAAHPETRLVATNTNPAVDALMRLTLSPPENRRPGEGDCRAEIHNRGRISVWGLTRAAAPSSIAADMRVGPGSHEAITTRTRCYSGRPQRTARASSWITSIRPVGARVAPYVPSLRTSTPPSSLPATRHPLPQLEGRHGTRLQPSRVGPRP